jgi:hypothetical protein
MNCDAVPAQVSQEDGDLVVGSPEGWVDGGVGPLYTITDASIPDRQVTLTFPSHYSAQVSAMRYSAVYTELTVV